MIPGGSRRPGARPVAAPRGSAADVAVAAVAVRCAFLLPGARVVVPRRASSPADRDCKLDWQPTYPSSLNYSQYLATLSRVADVAGAVAAFWTGRRPAVPS